MFHGDSEETSTGPDAFDSLLHGQLEKIEMEDASIIEPHENDVLLGRGGKAHQASGNEKCKCRTRLWWPEYQR